MTFAEKPDIPLESRRLVVFLSDYLGAVARKLNGVAGGKEPVVTKIETTPPALLANGQMVMNLTSNTNLRISVRGTDGTTRVANITLV